MINLDARNQSIPTASNSKRSWWRAKFLLFSLPIIGLGLVNVLTLMNEEAHTRGYNFLKAIAEHTLPDVVADRLIQHSPTVRNKQVIETATRSLHAANIGLEARNLQLAADNIQLLDTTKTLAAKTQDLAMKTNKLAHAAKTLADETNLLAREQVALRGSLAMLKTRSDVQRTAVKVFSHRLVTRSAFNASRNVATVPGKALPFVGTGIIVAATTWDLYDLCMTIKEMNAVNAQFEIEAEDVRKVCGLPAPSKEHALAQIRSNWKSVYQHAAHAINHEGEKVPSSAPSVGWKELRQTVCSVIGTSSAGCSN